MLEVFKDNIPDRIVVANPITGGRETGKLTLDGVYIGDEVDLGDHLHPSKFGSRVMILGKSSVRNWCQIGEGTIVNNASIFNAKLGKNVVLHEGSHVWGGNPFGAPRIEDDVIVGERSSVLPNSKVGAKSVIGNNVIIDCVRINEDSVIGDGSRIFAIIKT